MSDFLGNLAARSRGTLEAVRPRVPARFEPLRNADGLLAGRTPPSEGGLGVNLEMEGEVDAATALPTRLTRPLQPSSSRAEFAPQAVANPPGGPTASLANPPIAPPASPARADPVLGSNKAQGSDAVGLSTPVGRTSGGVLDPAPPLTQNPEPPTLEVTTRRTIQRVEPEIASRPAADELALGGRAAQTTAQSFEPSQAETPASGLLLPTARTPALPGPMKERPGPTPSVPASEVEPSRSPHIERMHTAQTAQSRPQRAMPLPLEPDRAQGVRPDSPRRTLDPAPARIPVSPSPAPRSPEGAPEGYLSVRPSPRQETAAGSEPARPAVPNLPSTTAPTASGAAEPAIRVTIGRVEVRAVFPEAAAKRSPPQRFKPSVSLDDYLNRGSGARR
jgi:hypothetical protein